MSHSSPVSAPSHPLAAILFLRLQAQVFYNAHAHPFPHANLLAASSPPPWAAILFLRSQAQIFHMNHRLPPVFLRSQLNSIVKDTTGIERELDQLRRDNVVRLFKLSTGR